MNQIADTNNKPILGAIAGIAVAGLWAQTVKGIVSFVPNLLPSLTPKEGVGPVPKAFRLKRHGIRLFAVIALTGIVTVLTPIQTQANPWKWLVETITSWAAGKTLDAATEALLRANGGITLTSASPTATANVLGSNWLSNEWSYEYRIQRKVDGPWETRTATASMGHQQEHKTAKGTHLYGSAMTQAEAVSKMDHGRYSIRWVQFEIFDDNGLFDNVEASARTDHINTFVNREFRKLRDFYRTNSPPVMTGVHWPEGTITLGPIWEIGTTTRHVGSYEMVSKFKNPSGNIALSKADAEDSDADEYKGTLYWQYYRVKANGNCYYPPTKRKRAFDFTTVSERHAVSYDACKSNQMLVENPKINAGAQRFFDDEPYTVWETQGPRTIIEVGLPPRVLPGKRVQVTKKRRVCNQTESDEYKQRR